MHVNDPDSHPKIFKMLRSLELTKFNSTDLSLATLLARLQPSTHIQLQRDLVGQLFLKTLHRNAWSFVAKPVFIPLYITDDSHKSYIIILLRFRS